MHFEDKFSERNVKQDETLNTFLPQDDEVELLNFIKKQEELLASNKEEVKEWEGDGGETVQNASG